MLLMHYHMKNYVGCGVLERFQKGRGMNQDIRFLNTFKIGYLSILEVLHHKYLKELVGNNIEGKWTITKCAGY